MSARPAIPPGTSPEGSGTTPILPVRLSAWAPVPRVQVRAPGVSPSPAIVVLLMLASADSGVPEMLAHGNNGFFRNTPVSRRDAPVAPAASCIAPGPNDVGP